MKTSRFVWGLLLPLLFVSCSSERDEGVVFEKAKVVSSFPKEITLSLSDAQDVDLGILGIADLYSHDSMLMVVTRSDEPVIELFDYETLEPKGGFLRHGNGPNEVQPFAFPYSSLSRFVNKGDSLYLDFRNGMKNYLRWNLTAAYNGQGEFVKEVQYNFAPSALYRWILNDSTVLCKTLVDNNTRVVREVLVNGTDRTPGFLSELDKAKVQTENDGFVFNTLGTLVEYNPELDVVAEVSLYLDVINLYSLHSNYHESIQIGKKPVLISDIEALMKSGIYDCAHVKETVSSDSSFSLLYRDSAGDMSILQFGWDGKPLSRISLPEKVSSLDIHGKDIWTVSTDSEQVRRYTLQ